jgi:hypothetical protein
MALPISETLGYKVAQLKSFRRLRMHAREIRPKGDTNFKATDVECLYLITERRLFLEVQAMLDEKNAR